jgi:hypothetical protein
LKFGVIEGLGDYIYTSISNYSAFSLQDFFYPLCINGHKEKEPFFRRCAAFSAAPLLPIGGQKLFGEGLLLVHG